MKKIFISALALGLVACGIYEQDDGYLLDDVRNYETYPVHYYTEKEFDISERLTETKSVATHTYQRDVVVSAAVGQRMVDSETFNVKEFTKNKISAQNNAIISNSADEIYIKKGQEFIPIGTAKIDGKDYMLIDADAQGGILLVDNAGRVANSISTLRDGNLIFSKIKATVYPETLRIIQTDIKRRDISSPKANFEIRYDGLRNGLFELTYIDYTNSEQGIAQKYLYMQNSEYIDLRGVKMRITGVYPDRIEYMLLK